MITHKPQHVNFWTAGEQGPEGWYYEDIDGKLIGPYGSDIDCYISCGAYARNLDWERGMPEGRLDSYRKASKESL